MGLTSQEHLFKSFQENIDISNARVIDCMQERILSLEKANSDKQRIIEMLINLQGISDTNVSIQKDEKQGNDVALTHVGEKSKKRATTKTSDNRKAESNNNITTNKKKTNENGMIADNEQHDHAIHEKKEVVIIGDSIIKDINGRGLSKDKNVKVRSHPGATTLDLIDYVKPSVRKNPELIVIHSGTNEMTSDINTLKKIKKLVHEIREIDKQENVKIAISSIIHRDDKDVSQQIKDTNEKLKSYSESKGFMFIDHWNIDGSCLNKSRLHLNKKGSSYLAKNFINIFSTL